MWPIPLRKPLLSPLLVTPKAPQTPISQPEPKLPLSAAIYTPKRSTELRTLAEVTGVNFKKDPTARQLFRKLGKQIDPQNIEIAHSQRKVERLEAKVEELQPKKKGVVRKDPNDLFVRIEHVIQQQEFVQRICRPSEDLQQVRLEDCLFEFQLGS